jgi:hypothetical protein
VTRLVVAVLVVALLVGCDITGSKKEPPPQTLSHAQFVRAADRVCARAARRLKRLRKPKTIEQLSSEFQNFFIPTFESEIGALRLLAPPPRDAARFRLLLATLDSGDLLANHVLDSINARQVRRVKNLERQIRVVGKRAHALRKKLGLNCKQ